MKHFIILLHTLVLCGLLILSPINVHAEKVFIDTDVFNDHYESTNYLNQLNVYDYIEGNQFYPNQSISRSDVAKVIHTLFKDQLKKIRDYEEQPFIDVLSTNPYYESIIWSYEVGIFDGDHGRFKGEESLNRAQLAKILVNTFNLQSSSKTPSFIDVPEGHWAYDYIYTLYGLGITKGSNGYFMPNQPVTNGQFASFIYRTMQVTGLDEILASKEPKFKEKKQLASKNVLATFPSEYDFVWNQIGKNEQLELEGVNEKNEVVGFYSTIIGKELFDITIGESDKEDVLRLYGKGIEAILKNNTPYILAKDNGHAIYLIEGKYVTFFFDQFQSDVVRSILWIEEEYEMKKEGFYGNYRVEARQEGFENLMVELMNQARVIFGVPPLKSAQQYRETARKHSMDMVKNHFFSHTGSDGKNALERMLADGMNFIHGGGENLAAGAYNTIYAHEALMNSKGHRENILFKQYTHAFTGVAFDGTRPYWTINFFIANE